MSEGRGQGSGPVWRDVEGDVDETKKSRRKTKEGIKKEQRRREDRKEEKANETKERIPRAVFPEAFVCFVFSLVVK